MAWLLVMLIVAGGMAGPDEAKPPTSSRPASQPSSQPRLRGKVTPLGKVTKDMVKKTVLVEGTVVIAADKPSRTRKRIYICTIEQNDAVIEVVWWDDLNKKLTPEQKPQEGDTLRVRGEVTEYRKKLQIVPKRAADVEVVKPAS